VGENKKGSGTMKLRVILLAILAMVSLSLPSFADMAKFRGGLKDVVLSPLVISNNMKAESANAKFLPFGLVGGFLKGSFYMVKQILTGTYVIVTAPIDSLHK